MSERAKEKDEREKRKRNTKYPEANYAAGCVVLTNPQSTSLCWFCTQSPRALAHLNYFHAPLFLSLFHIYMCVYTIRFLFRDCFFFFPFNAPRVFFFRFLQLSASWSHYTKVLQFLVSVTFNTATIAHAYSSVQPHMMILCFFSFPSSLVSLSVSYGALLRLVSHSAIVFVHSSFFFFSCVFNSLFFFFNLRDTPTITVISLPFFLSCICYTTGMKLKWDTSESGEKKTERTVLHNNLFLFSKKCTSVFVSSKSREGRDVHSFLITLYLGKSLMSPCFGLRDWVPFFFH